MVAAPELPLALSISFAPESSTISMTMFNQPEPSQPALPLEFKYKYNPATPYAPIHEIVDDRNIRIKQVSSAVRRRRRAAMAWVPSIAVTDSSDLPRQHYWDLWGLAGKTGQDFKQMKVTDEFRDDGVTITADEVESFCRVIGLEGEAYQKSYKHGMQVPLDFGIKMGWRVSSVSSRSREVFERMLTFLEKPPAVHHEADLPARRRR